MEKKKYGWTALGIVGIIFTPMGILFLLLGVILWTYGAGKKPEDPTIFLAAFGGIGAIFTLTGFALLAADLLRRKKMERAFLGGYYVMAKITGVRTQNNVNMNGRHPVTVECRYDDPATGVTHIYHSRYLYIDVEPLLKDTEVPVYIDRNDDSVGFVDIDAVLPEIRVH